MSNSNLYIPGAVLLGVGLVLLIVTLILIFFTKVVIAKKIKIVLFAIAVVLLIAGAVLLGVGLSSTSNEKGTTTTIINKEVPFATSILFYSSPSQKINSVNVFGINVNYFREYPNIYVYPVEGTSLIPLSDDDVRLLSLAAPSVDVSSFRKERRSVNIFYDSGNSVLGDISTYYDAESVAQKQYANFHFTGNPDESAYKFAVNASGEGTTINYVV